MINIPQIKPTPLLGLEADFGSSVAASIWRKIINNHTWVERAYPIGSILFFHESITEADGTPKDAPNPDIWQLCDGSVISDADSPLNGQAVPNMLDLFPKGSTVEQNTGGQSTLNIQHNHGGSTGVTDDRGGRIADTGGDKSTGAPHTHSIDTRWSTAEPIIPRYTALQFYIRYK